MKKHLLVCLLALVLASLCMLPSQVQAAEETHYHCACGADHVSIDGHTTDSSSNWKPLPFDENGNVQWPTAGNRYYLTRDVVIDKTWAVEMTNAPIVLCLNGHNITMEGSGPAIEVNGTTSGINASLTITDCTGTGEITHKGTAEGPAVKVCGFGSFTMYGGTITGNHATGNGGGVCIDGENSKFTMYGGSITQNSATGSGGGVYVGNGKQAYVDVGGNAQIVGNKAGNNETSGIYFSVSGKKLYVKKLITDARIVIDNEAPESYITSGSNGNYAIDTTNGVLTAPSHKPHHLCGSSDHANCTSDTCRKATSEVTFTEWKRDDILPTSGNYYLTKNVNLSAGQTITQDVTLCLNGYKIEAASGVTVNGTLTITDCVGSGSIVGVDKKQTGVNIQSHTGTLNLYSGTIKNFEKGVVNNGTFNMYGGKLTKNSQGVSNTGTFNMHGGTITGNSGYCNGAGVSNDGSFTMSGGDITYNTASKDSNNNNGYGGGVYNSKSFKMTDGTIAGNNAGWYGGGVYGYSNTTYIYGGSITRNEARQGGGVYVGENCGVHLKGKVIIRNNYSHDLLANTAHYIDGPLETGSEIRLSVPSGKDSGTILLYQSGYTITDADLEKFSFTNTSAGYEMTLESNGSVKLILPHKHTLCNRTTHSGAGHSDSCGESITFKEWTDAEAQTMYSDSNATATAANCLPSSGDWYLTKPVTLTKTHEVGSKTLNLCLNGNSVTLGADGAVFSVKNGGVLNLTDCKGTGIITHAGSNNGTGVSVEAGSGETPAGTFNLYNGNITGNRNTNGEGGGVSVLSDGQFNMYGGTITENKAAIGGGVNVADNATVTIGGGTIKENTATTGGGMTVGNCQVTLSGKVTITDNKSTGGASNLYIDKNKGGKIVVLNDSLDSNSRVVFKDCDNQYAGTYYISNADKLDNAKLTCFTTDAGRKFVRAGDENKVYVATVLEDKPTVQKDLKYDGTEQTGVIVPDDADTYYTITGTTKDTQANAAYGQDSYKAVVKLNPGYALCDRDTRTYYVADTPLNLYWSIAPRKAAASDFVVTDSTLTTTYNEEYHGVTVTVAEQYKQNGENWDGKLEVQYQAKDGTWTNEAPKDAGTYNLRVRIANGANFAAGAVELSKSLTINRASQQAPAISTFTVTAPTSVNGKDGKITGVTIDMEYRTDDGQKWIPCTGDTISGPRGDYQIRYKAEQPNYDASPAIEVTIPPHAHDFCMEKVAQEYSAAPATCTEAATYYKSCACGTSSEDMIFTYGDPLGHNYKWEALDGGTHHAMHCTNGCDTWKMDTKAAHRYDGLEGTTCKDCDYVRTVEYYTVSIAVEGNGFGTVSANAVKNVPEGATITVNDGELTIRGTTDTKVTATASANTAQYTYTFTGWTIDGQSIPESYTINAPVTITASFNRVVNQYTVTWDAAGGTIQDTVYTSGTQDWGTQITAPTTVVKAPDSSCSYTFTGWQDAAGKAPAEKVTGDVTYTAQYTTAAHAYQADVWEHDDSSHWHVCTVFGCGYAAEKTLHTYADADATVCKVCGASRTLPKLTGMAEIIGELVKGERLTAVATDLPSTATATQLRCQWLRNDTIITGANDMDYTLTAEDVGAKISVNVTAVGHTGSLYAIAAGQVDVIYTVSYDTNGGTIGTLRQDRVKFGADYTLPECDFITAPDKMTFDLWEIDGVSYKAGTAYRVMNDVTVVALWKDAGSDRPAPTPSRPSHRGSTIEAISTMDGRSATDYSGGIYGLTFRSTAGFSSFLGVQVDGGTIAPSCYSAEEGSIVVYLKAVYLRTLKAGTHTITILSSEGNASMEFTVGGVTTSPKTFDAGVAGYVSIALLGLTGGSLCLRRKKDGNA